MENAFSNSVAFFKKLPVAKRGVLLRHAFLVHLPKKEILFHQGDVGHTFYGESATCSPAIPVHSLTCECCQWCCKASSAYT